MEANAVSRHRAASAGRQVRLLADPRELGDWPAMQIYYPCLPNYAASCRCTLVDRIEGRDCGIELPLPAVPEPRGAESGGAA